MKLDSESFIKTYSKPFVTLLACSVISLGSATKVFADTYYYPDDKKPIYTLDLPSSWNPTIDDSLIFEASSPKGDAYVSSWIIENEKELNNLTKDVEAILNRTLKNINFDDKEKEYISPSEMKFTYFKGTALDKKDNTKVKFSVYIFSPAPKKAGVVYEEFNADVDGKTFSQIQKAVSSIKIEKPTSKRGGVDDSEDDSEE